MYCIQYDADSISEWVSLADMKFRLFNPVKTEDGMPVSLL